MPSKCGLCHKEPSVVLAFIDEENQVKVGPNCLVLRSERVYGGLRNHVYLDYPSWENSFSEMSPRIHNRTKVIKLPRFYKHIYFMCSHKAEVKLDDLPFIIKIEPHKVHRFLLGARKLSVKVFKEREDEGVYNDCMEICACN